MDDGRTFSGYPRIRRCTINYRTVIKQSCRIIFPLLVGDLASAKAKGGRREERPGIEYRALCHPFVDVTHNLIRAEANFMYARARALRKSFRRQTVRGRGPSELIHVAGLNFAAGIRFSEGSFVVYHFDIARLAMLW